jgi:uncharacterized protein (TIGR02679 family)
MADLQKAVRFFKSESAYRRLFTKFRKKYESLGRIGGNVPIATFSDNELATIGAFFGISGEMLRSRGTVSLLQFEQQLAETRFGKIELKSLLDTYFGEVIISRKQLKEKKEAALQTFLQELAASHPQLEDWLLFLQNKTAEGRWIVKMAVDNEIEFRGIVQMLAKAVINMPDTAERLPMFSQRITGDPHAFDLHTNQGKMFLHLLAVKTYGGENFTAIYIPRTAEEINALLQTYSIYRDDLLNFVTCAGFIAETKAGVHPVWREAATHHTVQNAPLKEIASLTRIYPAKGKHVWIVENSGVCSTLLDYIPNAPVISTNGQFKLAALMLMDILVQEGCLLHYAGDFDPEGLQMAQRLADRYPDNISLWRMGQADYRKTVPVKSLSNEQLEKLKSIVHPHLIHAAGLMRQKAKAGYQEALLLDMVADIRRNQQDERI